MAFARIPPPLALPALALAASQALWAQTIPAMPEPVTGPARSAAAPQTPAAPPPLGDGPASPTQKITVTGQMHAGPLRVGGFAGNALSRTPIAASVLTESKLRDAGARGVADLTRLDASLSDAYNAEGYWGTLSVRGFSLDGRFNTRRDGLPVNGETVISLANKAAIELLKGASGIQAGTSAPGGLINHVVKRPTGSVHSATLQLRDASSMAASVDLGHRFGPDREWGLRVNAQSEQLRPLVRDAEGSRHALALAGDWQWTRDTLIEVETESSRQSQPSVPGYSLLGNRLPAASSVDARVNLNNQAWTQPVVFAGQTSSVRVKHTLPSQWQWVVHAMTQRLRNDDRVAFPYGCSAENTFDRYCSDGRFDLYDFRSDRERRTSDAVDFSANGIVRSGSIDHQVSAGVLSTRFKSRFERQAFNGAGVGHVDGSVQVPAAPALTDENTLRDERSLEVSLRDAIGLSPTTRLWLGLRHSQLKRNSVRTDGSRGTNYEQSFTTPWVALSHQITPRTMAYASAGQGIESDVAPNRARYTNAGQALPALRSRQVEVGVKHDGATLDATAAAFRITRPQASDLGPCDEANSCTRQMDGDARHLGVEGMVSWRFENLTIHTSAMVVQAKRQGAADAAQNGLRPVNVPAKTFRALAAYDVPGLAGLTLQAGLVYEGDRMVLPDNSLRAPGWTRWDLLARWQQVVSRHTTLTWRLGVDNATNTQAWKETPYQFGHAYLFPMAPRSWRASVQWDLN